jgi:hypothetical protein
VRVCHNVSVDFDDPNLVSAAGLVPVMALAEKAGLPDLVSEHVHVPDSAGANADLKVACLVAGMIAGADSIADMDLVRHGGLGKLFTGSRAPTTLGTHLRAFTFGHLRQLDAVASRLLVNLAGRVPALLGGAGQVAYLDIDDTIRATHGYAKQGVGYGYTKVKGLNVQVATVSTPTAAPVIAATRLRKGNTSSAHGAARLIADGLSTARKAGATGLVTVRADSAYYNHAVIAATARAGAHFSVTARMDARVTAAITRIPEDAWVGTKYPQAIWEEAEQRWISDAEVAETSYTAFTSRHKGAARHREVDRAPGQAAQPRIGASRPRRAVRHPPSPRRVHRLSLVDAGRGGLPPGPRDHRAGHRRPQGRAVGPRPLRELRRQLGVDRAGRDRVQPHPRRRDPGLDPARPSPARDHPCPADQHPRPDRQPGPAPAPAPTPGLALAGRLDRHVRGRLHPTGRRSSLTPPPDRTRNDPTWKSRADRRLPHAR